jgi:excisionase family DNA binding protein
MHDKEISQARSSDWLTLDEVSAYSKFSIITIRRALKKRHLVGYRLNGGRVWRVHRDALEAWLRGA